MILGVECHLRWRVIQTELCTCIQARMAGSFAFANIFLLERRVAWEPFAGRGVYDQLRALYPKLRPRVQRHPAQVQIGYEEARGALLGGRGKGAGAGGLQLWRRNATTGAASASPVALAAGSATAAPVAPGGHALAAAPALAHSAAAPSAA